MPRQDELVLRDYVGPVSVGLYLDRAAIFAPDAALQNCMNVRIKDGKLTNDRIGWQSFNGIVLDGEVTLIESYALTAGSETLFGTRKTLYRYEAVTTSVLTINPLYSTGTASVAGAVVTGTGTFWDTPADASNATWERSIRPGDMFFPGTANENDPEAVGWVEILSVASDTSFTLVSSIGPIVDGPYTIRKSFLGKSDEVWQSVVFPRKDADTKDYIYLTNGFEFVRWDPALDVIQVLLSVGFVPHNLTVHARVLIAMDITDNATGARVPGKVRTSAIGDPDNFVTLEAIEAFVTDGQEGIRVAREIGDYVSIYCQDSVRIASFIGPPVFWAFRNALPSVGIIGRNALMDFGDHHEFLSTDTLFAFDGVQNANVAPHVFRNALRSIAVDRLWQIIAQMDEERGEVTWVLPEISDPTDTGPAQALVTHYLEQFGAHVTSGQSTSKLVPITRRLLNATAMGPYVAEQSLRFEDFTDAFEDHQEPFNARAFGGLYPTTLFGDYLGRIFELNVSQSDESGVRLISFVEFVERPLIGDGDFTGLIQRIEPYLDEAVKGSMLIATYGSERLGGKRKLYSNDTYQLDGTGRRFVSPRREMRYATVRFTGFEDVWALGAYAITRVPGGTR